MQTESDSVVSRMVSRFEALNLIDRRTIARIGIMQLIEVGGALIQKIVFGADCCSVYYLNSGHL